jgi:hypothetical protein
MRDLIWAYVGSGSKIGPKRPVHSAATSKVYQKTLSTWQIASKQNQ